MESGIHSLPAVRFYLPFGNFQEVFRSGQSVNLKPGSSARIWLIHFERASMPAQLSEQKIL
ncbi:MAG: hypothetical protein CMN77_10335 [Spirochaetaceae bacterium]|nr:hypothetical protein [Spirochaetaceae bacterium]